MSVSSTLGRTRVQSGAGAPAGAKPRSLRKLLAKIWFYRAIYLLMLPGLLCILVFSYVPMWGVIIAFMDYRPWLGLRGSPWVGFANFALFFNSPYFVRLMRNTLLISLLNLAFVFPAPILLAMLLNEVNERRHNWYKRVIQTISYYPHFISWVVVGGILIYMFSVNVGLLSRVMTSLGLEPVTILGTKRTFLPLLVGSQIWKSVGWGAIIYLAAIAGINPELYEAAIVDGANRLQRALFVTLPSVAPVIIIMLILNIGSILNVNFQQILVLMGNNAALYEVGDVIDTWVYRVAFFQQQMGLGTAVGLFKGVVGLILVWAANRIANRVSEGGLW